MFEWVFVLDTVRSEENDLAFQKIPWLPFPRLRSEYLHMDPPRAAVPLLIRPNLFFARFFPPSHTSAFVLVLGSTRYETLVGSPLNQGVTGCKPNVDLGSFVPLLLQALFFPSPLFSLSLQRLPLCCDLLIVPYLLEPYTGTLNSKTPGKPLSRECTPEVLRSSAA